MNNFNCLSLVYETQKLTNGASKEYYKIYVQAIDTPENRQKLLQRSRDSTFNALDHGRFNEAWRLYAHSGVHFSHKKATLIELNNFTA